MRCPGCGYVSFDALETCKRCGAPMSAAAGPPVAAAPAEGRDEELQGLRLEAGPPEAEPAPRTRARRGRRGRPDAPCSDPVEMLDDDALEIGEADLSPVPDAGGPDPGMPFHIDDDLFAGQDSAGAEAAAHADWVEAGHTGQPDATDIAAPAFVLAEDDEAPGPGGAPLIDRDDEIPDRFWAPEIAGLGRRAAALFVDQSLLALLLGVFFAAAYLALRLSGFDTDLFLAAPGLRAALPPFALLAVVVSLAYQAFFHGYAGRTPGKALAGVEVRTADGAVPSWGRVLLRWLWASFGLACAGVGIAWALIDRRHRGWADLLSGTVIARRRRVTGGP